MSHFRIAFLSSSGFTLPILQDIHDNVGRELNVVLQNQIKDFSAFLSAQKDLKLIHPKFNPTSFTKLIDHLPNDLQNSKISLDLVISQPSTVNRNKIITNPIINFCLQNQIETFTPTKLNQEYEQKIDIINNLHLAITASFGQIVSQRVLDLPEYGFINWHPSKLPLHRGATPMQTALANGDDLTSLSWIEMMKEMDAGDLLLQIDKPLDKQIDFNILSDFMGQLGQKTWLLAALIQIAEKLGKNYKQSQAHSLASFCSILNKSDAVVDPKMQTAEQIFNHFRAYKHFPHTTFEDNSYFKQKIKLIECNPPIQLTLDEFKFSFEPSQINFENENWLQIKQNKELKTYLKCHGKTFLKIKQICNSSGKKINFTGYVFK